MTNITHNNQQYKLLIHINNQQYKLLIHIASPLCNHLPNLRLQ